MAVSEVPVCWDILVNGSVVITVLWISVLWFLNSSDGEGIPVFKKYDATSNCVSRSVISIICSLIFWFVVVVDFFWTSFYLHDSPFLFCCCFCFWLFPFLSLFADFDLLFFSSFKEQVYSPAACFLQFFFVCTTSLFRFKISLWLKVYSSIGTSLNISSCFINFCVAFLANSVKSSSSSVENKCAF